MILLWNVVGGARVKADFMGRVKIMIIKVVEGNYRN